MKTGPKYRFETIFEALRECWSNTFCYGVFDAQCDSSDKKCQGNQKSRETKNVYQLCISDKENLPSSVIGIKEAANKWQSDLLLTESRLGCVYLNAQR